MSFLVTGYALGQESDDEDEYGGYTQLLTPTLEAVLISGMKMSAFTYIRYLEKWDTGKLLLVRLMVELSISTCFSAASLTRSSM